jgi:F-type H+-transporting ATPase subunit a
VSRRTLTILGVLAALVVMFFLSVTFRTVPQPIIEIKGETLFELGPLPFRNTFFTSIVVSLILIAVAFVTGRSLKWLPSRWQNLIEIAIEGIRDLVTNAAGEKNGKRFFWVIATFFIYILVCNWFGLFPFFNGIGKVEEVTPHHFHDEAVVISDSVFGIIPFGAELIDIEVDETACEGTEGAEHEECIEHEREEAITHAKEENGLSEDEKLGVLIPYFRSVNTDLMATLSLAVVSVVFIEFWGISTLGFFSYGSRFFNIGPLLRGKPTGVIDLLVGFIELIAEFARLISFSFRLFGNIIAGEILLLIMTFLLPFFFAAISLFYGLEILVGAIQALVFGMLTLVFAAMAVTGHGDEHASEEGH